MKPPPRMQEDPGLPSELRMDVQRATAEPEDYDVAAGEAKLAAALGLGVPQLAGEDVALGEAAGASSATPGMLGSLGGKLAIASATVTVIAIAIVAWPEDTAPNARTTMPPSTEAEATNVVPRPPLAPQPEQAREVRTAQPPPQRAAGDMNDDLRREIAQVARIKALLGGDPAQAYRLAQAGHREFVRGMLREEREALAVLALWRMERTPQALRRSQAFLARYPQSAHREPIERHLQSERGRDADGR
jgi:hypothetical protein